MDQQAIQAYGLRITQVICKNDIYCFPRPLHRQAMSQICLKSGMTAREFYHGFSWLRSVGYLQLVKGSKATYLLTTSGVSLTWKLG